MKGYLRREDDFETRREHLKNLTDDELKERFWELSKEIMEPMLEIARTHTTPSIERAVLLRMGFSSIEVKPLVEEVINRGFIKYGAGHVVYALSQIKSISIRESGLKLINGEHWDDVTKYFSEVR